MTYLPFNDRKIAIYYGALSLFHTAIHNVYLLYHVNIFINFFEISTKWFWIAEIIFVFWNGLNDTIFGIFVDSEEILSSDTEAEYDKYNTLINYSNIAKNHYENATHIRKRNLTHAIKRIKSIAIYGPLYCISFMFFWYPIVPNYPGVQLIFTLCLYDAFLTIIDLNQHALLAELADNINSRVSMARYSSLFSVIGTFPLFYIQKVWMDQVSSNVLFPAKFSEGCILIGLISLVGYYLNTKKLHQLVKDKYLSLPRASFLTDDSESIYDEFEQSLINNPTNYNNSNKYPELYKDKKRNSDPNILSWSHPISTVLNISNNEKNSGNLNSRWSKLSVFKRSKKLTKNYINELWKRSNFRIYAAVTLFQTMHCHFNSNYFPIFLSVLFTNENAHNSEMPSSVWLLVSSFILPHVLNLYNLRLIENYGSYQVITVMFIVKISAGVILYAAVINRQDPENITGSWFLYIFIMTYIVFNRVLTEGICKLLSFPLADLCDEDRVTKGRNASAALSGTLSLFSKPGQSIAPLIGHFFLYNDQSKANVLRVMYFVPIVVGVIQCLLWSQYNLRPLRSYIWRQL